MLFALVVCAGDVRAVPRAGIAKSADCTFIKVAPGALPLSAVIA